MRRRASNFPSYFLTGLEEGLFPLAMAAQDPKELEEERRLFYVGRHPGQNTVVSIQCTQPISIWRAAAHGKESVL